MILWTSLLPLCSVAPQEAYSGDSRCRFRSGSRCRLGDGCGECWLGGGVAVAVTVSSPGFLLSAMIVLLSLRFIAPSLLIE